MTRFEVVLSEEGHALLERLFQIEQRAGAENGALTVGVFKDMVAGGPCEKAYIVGVTDLESFVTAVRGTAKIINCHCEETINAYVSERDGVWPFTDESKVLQAMRKAYSAGWEEWKENGFFSETLMTMAHDTLIRAVCDLAGAEGHVIDFGCGTGILLEKIVNRLPALIPIGVENDSIRAVVARSRLRGLGGILCEASMFAPDLWSHCPRSAQCGIFSLRRLLEVREGVADRFMEETVRRCGVVVPYMYGADRQQFIETCNRFDIATIETWESEHCFAAVKSRQSARLS